MNHLYVTLNKIQSHIITWGGPLNKVKELIICISGNPGVTDFYTEFGAALFKNTDIAVCVVGHAGHEKVPDEKSNMLMGQEELFDLEGQVNHKLDLINNHLDKDCKLHLIGHSIGAWMILEMLQKNKSLVHRISSVNLLFPTVQKMSKSRNGLFLNNVIRNLHIFAILLFKFINIIPTLIFNVILTLYMKFQSFPPHYAERLKKFLNPNVGEKVLFLAYNEMDRVQSLHTEIIDIIKSVTCVLYSPRDGWAPVRYMEDFRKFEPDLVLKQVDYDHAFVLKSSTEIAEIVSEFINNNSKL